MWDTSFKFNQRAFFFLVMSSFKYSDLSQLAVTYSSGVQQSSHRLSFWKLLLFSSVCLFVCCGVGAQQVSQLWIFPASFWIIHENPDGPVAKRRQASKTSLLSVLVAIATPRTEPTQSPSPDIGSIFLFLPSVIVRSGDSGRRRHRSLVWGAESVPASFNTPVHDGKETADCPSFSLGGQIRTSYGWPVWEMVQENPAATSPFLRQQRPRPTALLSMKTGGGRGGSPHPANPAERTDLYNLGRCSLKIFPLWNLEMPAPHPRKFKRELLVFPRQPKEWESRFEQRPSVRIVAHEDLLSLGVKCGSVLSWWVWTVCAGGSAGAAEPVWVLKAPPVQQVLNKKGKTRKPSGSAALSLLGSWQLLWILLWGGEHRLIRKILLALRGSPRPSRLLPPSETQHQDIGHKEIIRPCLSHQCIDGGVRF